MRTTSVLTFEQVGQVYRIEAAVLGEFADFGLFPAVESPRGPGVETAILERLERVVSLHRALGLNKEGIDAVLRLGSEIGLLQRAIEELEIDRERWRRRAGESGGQIVVDDLSDVEGQVGDEVLGRNHLEDG